MKINTPIGEQDADVIDFSLNEPERTLTITTEDGAVLMCRPTVAYVARWKNAEGGPEYYVQTSLSVVRTK